MKKRFLLLLCCCLMLVSCSEYAIKPGIADKFGAGESLSPELLEKYDESFPYGTTVKSETERKVDETTHAVPVLDASSVFYWTKSGTKLHIYRDCQSIRNSENTLSGSYYDAAGDGITELCDNCRKKAGFGEEEFVIVTTSAETTSGLDTVTEPGIVTAPVPTFDETSVFFWTKSGTKLHIYDDCQSFSKTAPENIISGNYGAAVEAGKTDVCSYCQKRAGLEDGEFVVETSSPQ